MHHRITLAFAGAVLLVACSKPAPDTTTATTTAAAATEAATPPATGPVTPPSTDAERITSAMAAGPESISKDATIIAFDSTMAMRTLRPGTNGWTCIPDGPSPGVDPMCLDKNGMDWAGAMMSKKAPPSGKMGFGYMLMGGSDASNTDPYATKPNGADKWVDTGPHVMVLNIGGNFAGYPTTPDNPKAPFVMFPNTPYAHLMLPVK